MKNEDFSMFSKETQLLYSGNSVAGCSLSPEAPPLFLASAFLIDGDLDDVSKAYEKEDYTYIRTRNPNRNMLAETISLLEGSESSAVFSSGMGAITTSLFAFLKAGDHILASDTLYGETIEMLADMPKYGIEVDFVDFTDIDKVEKGFKPNTKVVYSETISNPKITIIDVEEIAKLSHINGAIFIVDNTFGTPLCIKCIDLGADIVINSLTKFMNGHCDALLGSVSGKKELVDKVIAKQWLFGTTGGTFSSWLVLRGLRTLSLRYEKQMENARLLADALSRNPYVLKVNYPTVDGYPQAELAKKLFSGNGYGAMLSFEMPKGQREKMNDFMKRLKLVHYAPTLGGIRTTMSHPATSSHSELTEEERLAIGITDGMMRVSVGIENIDDLIKDFNQALEAYK